jgi:hypothetical protein
MSKDKMDKDAMKRGGMKKDNMQTSVPFTFARKSLLTRVLRN